MPITSLTFQSFFLFGLINNVLYVVILTAAHDLVPPTTPKAIILLADILPSFLLKLTLPFYIQKIPYNVRINTLILLSSIGMFLTSLPLSLGIVLFGIILASCSSGLGETTFLQLSHYYDKNSINGWSSGTGGAGLVGSGLFLITTTIFKISINWVLRFFALTPLIFVYIYYYKLPPPHTYDPELQQYEDIEAEDNSKKIDFRSTIDQMKPYFAIYMLPLIIVYFAEYVINQGVSPTMLFPISETPFITFRDSYVAYGTLYQIGVFISRSSGSLIRFRKLYLLGLLQFMVLSVCILQSLYMIIPNIWIVFLVVIFEGLLGGGAYVNTFLSVNEDIDPKEREFAMGCVGISDSFGIVLAAMFSMWLEPSLCKYQLSTGREWCTLN